ncbi:MAG: outer membrane protein [Candidatus Eisenbacteria bacterium]
MRRRIASSAALVVVSVLLAAPAFAQGYNPGAPGTKMWTFGVGGGVAVPVNDAKDALKNGFNGLAYARVRVPIVGMSLGVNVSFQRLDLKDATVSTGGSGTPTTVTGSTDVLGGLGDLRYDLMQGAIHPYITLGLGVYNLKTDYSATGLSGSESGTHFGVNGGAGLAIRFGAISGYVQGRIDNVYTDTGGVVDTKSIQVIPVTVGLEF